MDDVCLDLEVLGDEIGRTAGIRMNAAHLGGCEKHMIGPLSVEKLLNLALICQVEFLARPQHQIRITQLFQPTHNR
jgi:hypothetical protein